MNLDVQANMTDRREQLKKAAEVWAKDHPEQNSSARAELIGMLSERPRDAADFGELRSKYDIPKPIGFWIALHNDVARLGHAPTNEKRKMYYLASLENDAEYWGWISESDAQPAKSKLPSAAKNVSFVASRPFFVGEVHVGKSPLCFQDQYVVLNVMSATEGPVSNVSLPYVPKDALEEGEFVVGLNPATGDPFVFFNQKRNSAVQVLMWDSFKESAADPSAVDYLSKHPTGVLTANFTTVLGNENRPGHVVIRDKSGVYLKGFSSTGNGVVRYSNVEKYIGDFLQVASRNQVTELKYRGNSFAILVPERDNPYAEEHKHAVIDCDGWLPLNVAEYKDITSAPEGEEKAVPDNAQEQPEINASELLINDAGGLPISGDSMSEERAQTSSSKIEFEVGRTNWQADDFLSAENSEKEFLARFFNFVNATGFLYEPRDLLRFHASVKSGFFTLLGGDPGTGKSSLALLYSKAIAGSGYRNDDTYLRVDVNPSWLEPEDLIGYYSATSHKFREAPTGLVSFLKNAQAIDEARIVCFEELNLAHVEQYFSDFIQQMSRKDGDRYIKIENADEPTIVALKKNLRFVGTINFDETTHELSARFYDRCNYIELTQMGVERLLRHQAQIDEKLLSSGCAGDAIDSELLTNWVRHGDAVNVDGRVIDTIKKVAPLLRALHLSLSPRTLQSMLDYIASRPALKTECDPQMLALDEAFVQRVLPVYRRPNDRKQIEQDKLRAFFVENNLALSVGFLDRVLGIEVPYNDDLDS